MFNRDEVITWSAIARYFYVSRATIHRWHKDAPLPVVYLGGNVRSTKRQLEAYKRQYSTRHRTPLTKNSIDTLKHFDTPNYWEEEND